MTADQPNIDPRSASEERTDPEGVWRRRGVRLIGWTVLLAQSGVLVRDRILGTPLLPAVLAILAAGIALSALALRLNQRGRSWGAARILAFLLPVLATALALASGSGFADPAVLILPVTVLVSAALLDGRAVAATTALAAAGAVAVLVADSRWLAADLIDASLILLSSGICVGVVASRVRRIIERLRQQEADLRSSELRYRTLVELAADAILVASRTAGITEANRRAIELTGRTRDELLGSAIESIFVPGDPELPPLFQQGGLAGEPVVEERTVARPGGGSVPVEMSRTLLPDGTLHAILRDISERHRARSDRRELEERLRRAHKMEAVGRLAGGIAHDFNNLLAGLTGSLTLALRHVPNESPAHRWLVEVDKAAWRAAALTEHLLSFSRQHATEPKVIDLRAVVESASDRARRAVGDSIDLQVRLAGEPCPVQIDQNQMEQVLLNLVTNAKDAMPDGGRLTLSAGWAEEEQLPEAVRREHGPRRLAVLSVADTGHGMRDDVRSRIFEPFFTTKLSGSSAGLGLAVVYGTVEQNGGSIDVCSAPGSGSCFRIFLPAAE